MNVIPHLLGFIAVYLVNAPDNIALNQVTQKAMQFHAAVVGSGETTTAKTARLHSEIPRIFLNQDIGGYFRSPKKTMLALIDRIVLLDAIGKSRIIIIPTRRKLLQANPIGAVTIYLVSTHVNENRF